MKFVRVEFKEANKGKFGGKTKGISIEGAQQVVDKYCTNMRIEKAIFKFVDEGKELDMNLMPMIIGYVYQDIWTEEWKTIVKKMKECNFVTMRQLIADRCRAVLNQTIINNELQ